jgi:hypothetical protein
MNRWIYPLMLTILVWLPACVTPHGTSQIKPISPAVGDPHLFRKVASLQPTLQWEPPPAPGTTYDLVIYEGIKVTSFWKGTKRSIGRQVYYRQGITTSSHRVEDTLKPNMEYYWSVRVRRDGIVSDWAKYDYKALTPIYYKEGRALPFMFKTPKL